MCYEISKNSFRSQGTDPFPVGISRLQAHVHFNPFPERCLFLTFYGVESLLEQGRRIILAANRAMVHEMIDKDKSGQ